MNRIITVAITMLIGAALAAPATLASQARDTIARNSTRDSVLLEQLRSAQESYRRALLELQANLRDSASIAQLHRSADLERALAEARTIELYALRAITRRQLDSQLGVQRADSIVRTMQLDTARARVTVLEQLVNEVRARQMARDTLAQEARFLRMSAPFRLPAVSLGLGLECSDCSNRSVNPNGWMVWSFGSNPMVGAVESGSVAERLGLRRGDTLKTVDDIPLTTARGGERLSTIRPGETIRLGWSRDGVAHSASISVPRTMPSATGNADAVRLNQTVGNVRVEVRGNRASWTRDPATGALRITGDSITVLVHPPGAVRDTVRR